MSPVDVTSRFNVAARGPRHPTIRPADAAVLILVDRSKRTPRLLFGRRNPAMRFMPGKLVFPGGRLEPKDRHMPVYGMLDAESERRLAARVVRPSAARSRGLALAAIREAFEETGLALGTREAGTPERMPDGWQDFGAAGLFPNLEALTFVARAITPPGLVRRFDTRFFIADLADVSHRVDGVIGPEREFVEAAWLTPDEARGAEIPDITRAIVEEVETRLSGGNKPWLPVPLYFARGKRMYREPLA
ncbi:NUDIX hydrolase [Ancylobacter mangrovi]|uniref:NUDIX domain-containing protein n=1 Tax=Ancylobacter mangrovi TaxID=2972472 RepID=A0A9X2T4Y1_9HYPH|nr:NUDIX domain-containing protein [Ancylobacter mangrovi]MCS0496656.1 NUDIX domain-containing protein [Ancylobacter mangrovi]MCS0505262.1 NUDIX domain-containing protein [Ancylobacter mangrovi]